MMRSWRCSFIYAKCKPSTSNCVSIDKYGTKSSKHSLFPSVVICPQPGPLNGYCNKRRQRSSALTSPGIDKRSQSGESPAWDAFWTLGIDHTSGQ